MGIKRFENIYLIVMIHNWLRLLSAAELPIKGPAAFFRRSSLSLSLSLSLSFSLSYYLGFYLFRCMFKRLRSLVLAHKSKFVHDRGFPSVSLL